MNGRGSGGGMRGVGGAISSESGMVKGVLAIMSLS
jgi:hypothetical protein